MLSAMGLLSGQSVRTLYAIDTIMHNVANIDTPGFKNVMLSYLPDPTHSRWNDRVAVEPRETVDFRQGPILGTGNPLDMAIRGDGFFVIDTPHGEAYTRDGRFALNSAGELVTLSGYPVMGDGGVIRLEGGELHVDVAGTIWVDGVAVDTLRIVRFDSPGALGRADAGLFFDAHDRAGRVDADATVAARSLEGSNVSAIQEMVRIIDANRVFESYQKVMQTVQEMDSLSTGRIGRIS